MGGACWVDCDTNAFAKNLARPRLSRSPCDRTPHVFHKPRAFALDSDKPTATIMLPKSARNPLFEETSERAIRTAHRRKWTLLASIGVVLGAAIGFWAFNKQQERTARSVAVEYVAIDTLYVDEQTKFQESLRAAGDAADYTKSADHTASAQRFAEFSRKYPSDPLGWQAALRAASAFIEAKKPKEAQELLENVERRTLKNNIAQARLRRTLAGIYADAGEFDKAIAELEFAEKLPDNPALEETKLLHAQILYLAGKKPEAAAMLRTLASSVSTEGADASGGRSVATEAGLWLGYWGL